MTMVDSIDEGEEEGNIEVLLWGGIQNDSIEMQVDGSVFHVHVLRFPSVQSHLPPPCCAATRRPLSWQSLRRLDCGRAFSGCHCRRQCEGT